MTQEEYRKTAEVTGSHGVSGVCRGQKLPAAGITGAV